MSRSYSAVILLKKKNKGVGKYTVKFALLFNEYGKGYTKKERERGGLNERAW